MLGFYGVALTSMTPVPPIYSIAHFMCGEVRKY